MQALGSIISGTEDIKRNTDRGTDSGSDSAEGGIDSIEKRASEPETIAGYPAISPIEWTNAGTDIGSSPTKRRGRPPGSKNRGNAGTNSERSTEKAQTNLADLDGLILSAHLMVAKILSVPELELDEKESEKLANSIRNVAKHYTAILDPKKIAIFELTCCVGSIYGPRAIAIYKNTERKPKLVKMTEKREPEQQRPASGEKVSLSELSPSQIWNEGG
jgi:hypothetical protein